MTCSSMKTAYKTVWVSSFQDYIMNRRRKRKNEEKVGKYAMKMLTFVISELFILSRFFSFSKKFSKLFKIPFQFISEPITKCQF